jgi:hypothetical protein
VVQSRSTVSSTVSASPLTREGRTVSKWEARGDTITLLPDTQALLDTALDRPVDDVKTRFTTSTG